MESLPVIILLFILGLVFIIKGGDWFVDAAGWIAEVSGIPRFIVGATIVSLATTLPELFVSCIAASARPTWPSATPSARSRPTRGSSWR